MSVFDWAAHVAAIVESHQLEVEQYERRIQDLEFALTVQREVSKDLHLKLYHARTAATAVGAYVEQDPKCPF